MAKKDLSEHRKKMNDRLNRTIARKTTRLMNNTKWREVLEIWNNRNEYGIRVARIKFLRSKGACYAGGLPSVNEAWCDGFPGPFQYKEIEWMEFPIRTEYRGGRDRDVPLEIVQDLTSFRKALMALGHLPIVDTENGFRIVAYMD